ncbi:MAG: three-Cys-motif partner protein TcmP [Anaerolineae bacterium]|nr:three-Cys-motif partner protein TcmP [Anaerolineae bacterium]
MRDLDDEFFRDKRPWSKIKDKVIGGYMPAYLRKVALLGKPILLVDGYAGPGVFDDGEPGSPLIMCSAAEKYVKSQYSALFVNHNPSHHNKLQEILVKQGWNSRAKAILGDSSQLLNILSTQLRDQTVFVYLDPFGLKGCEFNTLKPFLTRSNQFSTEIVINMSMPITHRLAAPKAKAEGRENDPRITSNRNRMTKVFGGDYWQEIYFSDMLAGEKEFAVMEEYRNLISQYLPYTGSCPVRESTSSRIKYFITFASRHIDAMLLLNDEMCKAYFGQMHEADFGDLPLFANTNWQSFRTSKQLDSIVIAILKKNPGIKRKALWELIIQEHFMKFTASEYKESVKNLAGRTTGERIIVTYTETNRLNDNCGLLFTDT